MVPEGWDLTGPGCTSELGSSTIDTGSPPTATITLAVGDTVTCTFSNTQRGHIVVDKVTVPGDDPESFTFNTTGTGYTGFSLIDTDTPNNQELVPGEYSVTETVPDVWNLTDLSCTSELGGSGIDTGSPPTATIALAAGDTVTCVFTNTLVPPAGESTDSGGVGQDLYHTYETVYATGSGFRPNSEVDVHVVEDRAWTDGDPIPDDVSGRTETVTTKGDGGLGPADVWAPPVTPGEYDIVFDANRNGQFDAATDAVDDPNHPGFVVQGAQPVGGVVMPVERMELLAPWIELAALVAAAPLAGLVVALVRRRMV
jgi:hypothetical protein